VVIPTAIIITSISYRLKGSIARKASRRLLEFPDSGSVIAIGYVIYFTLQVFTGVAVSKLNSFAFHLGTTAEGKEHAGEEEQGEGVSHG